VSQKVTLTQEELKEFQSLREKTFETVGILGDLTYRKTLIEFELETLNQTIKENAQKEKALLTKFGDKYGNGSINVETGEITLL
jgi:hypothetical protein